jgi:hypothetical protein
LPRTTFEDANGMHRYQRRQQQRHT